MTYFWQHPSAQPYCAGTHRHAREASTRFRQDMKVQISAYESWEYPLCVAKFLDMDHIFPYLWICIFISVKIRYTVPSDMDPGLAIRRIEQNASSFHMHQFAP